MPTGERGDGEEHSGGHVGGGRVQRIDMRHDDAAVTASDTQHDESRQADAGDEHGLQAGDKAGENGMQERTQRGKGSRQEGGKQQGRNMSGL